MSRSRTKTAEADTAEPDVFDEAIAAHEAQALVNDVAAATEMPADVVGEAPSGSRAGAVKRKQYKPLPDPFGGHIIDLTNDPDGPKARLLRSKSHNDMWIQFSEKPSEEILSQLKEAGFRWEGRAASDFARGAWVIELDPEQPWRNHSHAEQVFTDLVNQIRDKNGMEPYLPMAQSR